VDLRGGMLDDDVDPDVTRIRDEAASKNPVRNRMRIDTIDLPPDRLAGIVSTGRDFFHTFINGTLGRRYKRPPIYLVDNWVIGALGAFMERGRRRLPGTRQSDGPRTELDLSAPVRGLGPALGLFKALHDVQEILRGVRLIRLDDAERRLEDYCLALATGAGAVDDLANLADQVSQLVDRATVVLKADLFVGPYVAPGVAARLRVAIGALIDAAMLVRSSPLPELPGTGFSTRRPAGVLFGSIPELDIEGPAILLAPARILGWSRTFPGLHAVSKDLSAEGMEAWFGVKEPQQRAGAIALVNILHHEMTHAMVNLPTDPVQDAAELFEKRWTLYDDHPGFEEGFCDATAAVSTGVALLKAKFDIKGRGLPRLNVGKYAAPWEEVFAAIAPTYRGYYGADTDKWLTAWERNKRDFKAFSGVVGLYATNCSGFDWMATFKAFEGGQISTRR
jgi:hypothetical protein